MDSICNSCNVFYLNLIFPFFSVSFSSLISISSSVSFKCFIVLISPRSSFISIPSSSFSLAFRHLEVCPKYVVGQRGPCSGFLIPSQAPTLLCCEVQRWYSCQPQCKVAAVRQFGGRHRPLPVLRERPSRQQPCCKKSSPNSKIQAPK